MTLREQLEAKKRRRLSVPVLVSDPAEDQAVLQALAVALHLAEERGDQAAAEKLRGQVAEQAEQVQAHWVKVELQAMPRDEWRAATGEWQTVEVTDDGPEVVTDWAQALAPLLAESCVDPDLRDADWWAEQLAQPAWSEGDTNALQLALLRLNVDAVDPQVPKG